MSTPLHPHRLRIEQERGAGGQYVPARYAQMRCDGMMGTCWLPPERAPRVIVPPKAGCLIGLGMSPRMQARAALAWGAPRPLRMLTTLHYCRRHQSEATLEALLSDRIKADFERMARASWSHEYTPDFDRAFIDWLLVTTPEYRRFLESIEIGVTSVGGVPIL